MSNMAKRTSHVVTGSGAGRANPVFDLLGVLFTGGQWLVFFCFFFFFFPAGLIGRVRKVTHQANQITQPSLVLNKAQWLIKGHS